MTPLLLVLTALLIAAATTWLLRRRRRRGPGSVTVRVTADVSGFVDSMRRAGAAAEGFHRRLEQRNRRQRRRRWVVIALEAACTALDRIPAIERDVGRWRLFRFGGWGCRIGLARRSAELDEHWGTGEWGDAR